MAVLCLVLALGIFAFSFVLRKDEDILAQRGVRVFGTVLAHRHDSNRSPGEPRESARHTYSLEVQYLSSVPTKQFSVSKHDYDLIRNFTPVEVIYDPENPKLARLGGDLAKNTSSEAILFAAILGAVGLALGIYGWKLRKDARDEAPDLDEALMNARRGR